MPKGLRFAGVNALFTLLFFAASAMAAEAPVASTPGVAVKQAVVNFRELARQEALAPPKKVKYVPGKPEPVPHDLPVPEEALKSTETRFKGPLPDAALPAVAPLSPPTTIDFPALGDDNTRIPPDVNGAVGTGNFLMTILNSQVRIQNRSGGIISTISLQTFWAPVGPFSSAVGAFDPKVLFDPYNNRWMTTACTDPQLGTSSLLIGVSATSDPTGLWHLRRVDVDGANMVWADYPSVGFNMNWICVQVNMFNILGNAFNRTHIYCFDKAALYAGGPGAFALISMAAIGGIQAPAITYDNTLPNLYLLQTWNGNSGGSGFLRLYTITGPVAAPVLTPGPFPTVAAPWDYCPFPPVCASDFAPQMGSANLIANGDDRMQTVIYRNGTLWATHGVFLPAGGPNRSSVQWWQLNVGGGVMQFGRIDDAVPPLTYYAYPSIAVNKFNDVLIGYSRFSSTQFASGNYSYRAGADPPNTLQSDAVLKAGENTYFKTFGGPLNRWGDYSNAVVDPLDDKTLWTIQEYAASPVNFWGTWWGRIKCVIGDLDNTGTIAPAQAVRMLRCVYIGDCPVPDCPADANCDGVIAPSDLVVVLLLIFAGIPPSC